MTTASVDHLDAQTLTVLDDASLGSSPDATVTIAGQLVGPQCLNYLGQNNIVLPSTLAPNAVVTVSGLSAIGQIFLPLSTTVPAGQFINIANFNAGFDLHVLAQPPDVLYRTNTVPMVPVPFVTIAAGNGNGRTSSNTGQNAWMG